MRVFILMLLLTMAGYQLSFANNHSCEDENKTDIVLVKGNADDETKHARIPTNLTLTCYYENGTVYLNVPFELGSVTLTVTNLATSEVWNYRQESGFGWIVLPTSQAQGSYMVEVKTEFQGDYIGYYNIQN